MSSCHYGRVTAAGGGQVRTRLVTKSGWSTSRKRRASSPGPFAHFEVSKRQDGNNRYQGNDGYLELQIYTGMPAPQLNSFSVEPQSDRPGVAEARKDLTHWAGTPPASTGSTVVPGGGCAATDSVAAGAAAGGDVGPGRGGPDGPSLRRAGALRW